MNGYQIIEFISILILLGVVLLLHWKFSKLLASLTENKETIAANNRMIFNLSELVNKMWREITDLKERLFGGTESIETRVEKLEYNMEDMVVAVEELDERVKNIEVEPEHK